MLIGNAEEVFGASFASINSQTVCIITSPWTFHSERLSLDRLATPPEARRHG